MAIYLHIAHHMGIKIYQILYSNLPKGVAGYSNMLLLKKNLGGFSQKKTLHLLVR
jgi:hypothetical protein